MGMEKQILRLGFLLFIWTSNSYAQLVCPEGWFVGGAKCYRIFHGDNRRAYQRAKETCESYGSRLVIIKDQLENDLIGAKVEEIASVGETYYIGMSKETGDTCSTCTDLKWSNGEDASVYEGFWRDDEPNESEGGCVFAMNNIEERHLYDRLNNREQRYVYERPYAWAFSNCLMQRSFVCERMAAPTETFHCATGGYINSKNVCDGNSDCDDGSDELDCRSNCSYYQTLPTGDNAQLGQLIYNDTMTCTWAIETPPGTNAYVQLNNFNTEFQADYVTVYIGSISETRATLVDRISGNIGTKTYRSYNNMMFVKFSSDSSVSNTGTMTGFSGIYGALKVNTGQVVSLTAFDTSRTYSVSTFDVADSNAFLGQRDYLIVIETEKDDQFGPMITLEIEAIKINDGDSIMFFDGGNPLAPLLSSSCNDDDACTNYNVVYSTGKKLSIVLRTEKTVSNDVAFRFRYRQGCYFETTEKSGTLYTPGYPGKIDYTNFVTCTWIINVNEPIAVYFDPDSRLQDKDHSRPVNGDFLKMYDDGTMVTGSSEYGLTTSDLAGKVFTPTSGKIRLELASSSTRSARGFLATWSTACPDPNYDDGNTIVNPSEPVRHYMSTMEVSCKTGYAFQQEQTQITDVPLSYRTSVTMECGFKGIWKNYLQIPKCTPWYCGPVPSIPNGIIQSATSVVYGGNATYRCNTGSVESITCQAGGIWSQRPSCIADTCPRVISTTIANGNGVLRNGDGTSIGTVYEFNCSAGFEFDGEPFVFCQEDGTWTKDRAPSCRSLTCLLPEIEDGSYLGGNSAGRFISFGDSASVTCGTGYQFAANSPTSVTCNADRTLTGLPQCVDQDECDTPGRCEGECHNTIGSFYCTCGSGYTLRQDQFTCQDVDECDLDIDNCDGLCDNRVGTYVCSCSPPYVLYTGDMTSGFDIPTSAGERGDLPTDTYHINHTCVLVRCDDPDPVVPNGQLLTKRTMHHYGDFIEYQCDIGYTPLKTIRECDRDGNWIGNAPTCVAAECFDTVGSVLKRPTFEPAPYAYGEQLIMECEVANRKFNRTRFCTYNKELDRYEMQGSSYECGVVDCGQPKQEPGSNYGSVSSTTFGSTFLFTCQSGGREGSSASGSTANTVTCLADGYWDFGNLQCTGEKCNDPGYPAGGNIVATSFADKSTVTFTCDKDGYTLTDDVTLTCRGTNFFSFGESVPQCVDTQDPVIVGCPTSPIQVNKYEYLRNRLPSLTVTDNTGIKSSTISPRNANSTLYVSQDLDVTYTVMDHASNTATCTVQVRLNDETPPVVTCPSVRYVELETDTSSVQYDKLEKGDVFTSDIDSIKLFQVTGEPETLTVADLYKTYTYTISVTDLSDNPASCQGQIFVRPKPCSDLDFPTPLDADKVCTPLSGFPADGRECTLTCKTSYTFEDSKTKTVRCGNGAWDTGRIPACIRDVTAPEVGCQFSRQIDNLSARNSQHEVDFTVFKGSVTWSDLNTANEPVFSPERYTFTTADLYRPKVVTVSVTDAAGNTGFCNFQYTAIPPVCSELSLPVPQFGQVQCTERTNGWDCTISCDTGKILRNHGSTKSVSCNDNFPWSDNDIYPACIDDTKVPIITCPASRTEKLYTGNEVRTVTFAGNSGYTHTETDYSDIKSVIFNPPSSTLSIAQLNTAVPVTMTVTDNANNQASCSFQVLVEADVCSPLALRAPENGERVCNPTSNGYSCNITCNAGHSFYGTTDKYVITSCFSGQKFSQYIPDCVLDSGTQDKQYIATLRYEYVPESDTVFTVSDDCIDYYKNKLIQPSGSSILDQMEGRLYSSCNAAHGEFNGLLSISFFPSSTTGNVRTDNRRRVEMFYKYTVLSNLNTPDPDIDHKCTKNFNTTLRELENTFPLSRNIDGDGSCPTLKWNSIAEVTDENEYCAPPYYESLADSSQCLRCPAGTQSDGVRCSVCQEGYFRTSAGTGCEQCPTGFTTRYPGAINSNFCVALCTGSGEVSTTGYSPCYSCPIGQYKISNTQCQSCGLGKTTVNVGSQSADACVESTSINDELCTIGTQDIGNRVCEVCTVGTYRSVNTQACVPCTNTQTSTYVKGATSSSQCYGKCSNGFTSVSGRAPCTPCPKGQYAVNETTCETCPNGHTTLTTGSTVCVRLTDIRLRCPRGTSRDINTGQCNKCSEGSYSSIEEGSCISCDSTEFTYYSGATSETMCQTKCQPGFYSLTGLSPCTPCGIGRYSTNFGATACTVCSTSNDMITATTTSTSNQQCIAKCAKGTFSYDGYNLNGACRQCPRNYYQNQEGQTSCIQCTANSRFTRNPGQTEFSQCLTLASEAECDNRCTNGNCVFQDNEAVCQCPEGQYYGDSNCLTPVNHCLSQPCYNGGFCSSTAAGYTCNCDGTGATGSRCETITKLCDVTQTGATCKNGGHCINRPGSTECLCATGYSGATCSDKEEICGPASCDSVGTRECRDVSRDSDLRRYCECNPGYTGETCSEDIDECASTPCINGGTCVNEVNRFRCDCPTGYSGTYCQTRAKLCDFFNCRQYDSAATCVDVYSKDEPGCICNPGFSYDGDGYTQYQIRLNTGPNLEGFLIQPSANTPEQCRIICTDLGTTCNRFVFDTVNKKCYTFSPNIQLTLISNSNVNTYTKDVRFYDDDFYTLRYNLNTPTFSSSGDSELLNTLRDVYGLNICGGSQPLSARCCEVGKTCLDNEGLPFGAQCTAAGLSITNTQTDYTVQFKCSVNRVFQSNVCRQKTDYCGSGTCQNGGICRNIFGAHVCTCDTGYTGRNCQTNIDDCAVNPCNNGGTCEDKVGFYSCKCTPEYEGTNCNSPKDFCALNQNCNGRGSCSNIAGIGYECSCFRGYEGKDCELETDYCKSNPCQHGGTCNKRLGGYSCDCVAGWTGGNCDTPVEHCSLQQSGGQCQSDCFNIFNGYYCRCEENTFGTNCEFKPNPCRDYNKCQNGAGCSYDGSMSCTCPTKYHGDGCQILRDYCGKTNPCENDAVCSVTDTGYQCTCKPGFNGVRCENEINECDTVSCPGNGKCYDAINKHYCRCPIKYTGTNCQKVFDRNYDMFFNHPQGYGFAWIPYFIQVTSADFISVTLWVRYSKSGGTGVYLTQFIGDTLEEADRFMEFSEEGTRVYVQKGSDPYIQLTYDRDAKVNDGNWHLVTVLCDMVTGEVKHYLDGIFHDLDSANDLIMPAATFRMWVVLGCEFDNVEHRCMESGRGFHGYLSQVNWYKRELAFEGDRSSTTLEGREGEIPRIYRLPQYIFDSNVDDILLVWNEYEFESGVSRLAPSEAQGALCSNIARNPPCSSYRTTTLPSVTDCPDDMVVHSADRIVTVTWTEPKFLNLGAKGRVVKPTQLPGSTFTWGVYRKTYIGIDGNNNKAFCHINIHVTDGQCESPPNLYGGTQSCNNISGRKGCMISCDAVNQNTYMVDRVHPDIFTCGPSGWWNAAKPFRQFRYPSCGLVKEVPKQRIYIRASYSIGTTACIPAVRNINVRTYEVFRNLTEIFDGDLCQSVDCSDITVDLDCGPVNQGKRRRRQAITESVVLSEITLGPVNARTMLNLEDISTVDFLTYFFLGAEYFLFGTVPNSLFEKENFEIIATDICPVGQVLRNGYCVECGPGNYFRYTDSKNTTAICDDCPLGEYQDNSAATACKPCEAGFTTEMTGEYLQSSCKKSCPVGEYFKSSIQDCQKCEIGYYQDEVGQFRCKGCPAGYTTKEEGSISSSLCSVSCDSGYQLNDIGECAPCSIGEYRNAAETRTCVSCTTGFITAAIASVSEAKCDIVDCSAGTYRDVDQNKCIDCPKGSYQPDARKTSCISCGNETRWRTESEGSSLQNQCLYYCPSGFEVKQDPNYRCQICPIGTYKDNTLDIQGSCLACQGNLRTEKEGSSASSDCSIYKCPVGFRPNTQNNGCVQCPLGFYQDVEYSTECKECQDGYSTRETASNSSAQCEEYCPSGEERVGRLCLPCKRGFFKDNSNGLFKLCQECAPEYTTAGTGSKNSTACNTRTCPPGTKRTQDDTGCEDCPIGTYQPDAYMKDCKICPDPLTSTRTTKSTSQNDCERYCESGYEKIGTQCVGCGRGYTKDNANDGKFASCQLCPLDFITAGNNTDSASLCNIGNCSAGEYLKADKTCALCEKGFYQPEKWQDVCIKCGKDKTTENLGSDELSDCILECSPGFEDVGGSCQQCKRGFYKVESAATSCKQCPDGVTTVATGANTADLCILPACPVGQYLYRATVSADPECRRCPYDTYQDEIWQEQCKPCLGNNVTLQMGADESSDCVLDCASGREYNAARGCEFCVIGYYRNRDDRQQTQCQRCPIDKLTGGEGGKDVSECVIANCTEAGYFRDTTTETCKKCPIGTFNSQWWQTSCTDCPLGNSTRVTGATSIDDCRSICPLGQYVGTNNNCELCERGTYRSDMAVDTCTRCPNGLLTPGPGANSENDCSISPCNPGQRYVLNDLQCVDCSLGTYQPNSGSFQCFECPFAIKFTTPRQGAVSEDQCRSPCSAGEEFQAGTTSCVPCPRGTYQPAQFQFSCLQCPDGRKYTEDTGAQQIEQCLSYCSIPAANDCSLNASCSVSSTNTQGYTCDCFTNYESTGATTGEVCVHKCDLGHCKNGATCTREPTLSCSCSRWYEGDRCEMRIKGEELSDKTLDIVIPVAIAAGGLILFLIILAVCCLCWRRSRPMKAPEPQYSEFNGDRVDKGSIVNYGVPYGSRPPSRLMMLAPAQEMYYDNQMMYSTKDHSAVYEA